MRLPASPMSRGGGGAPPRPEVPGALLDGPASAPTDCPAVRRPRRIRAVRSGTTPGPMVCVWGGGADCLLCARAMAQRPLQRGGGSEAKHTSAYLQNGPRVRAPFIDREFLPED